MARTQPPSKKVRKDRKQLDSSDEEDKGLEIDEKNSAPAENSIRTLHRRTSGDLFEAWQNFHDSRYFCS